MRKMEHPRLLEVKSLFEFPENVITSIAPAHCPRKPPVEIIGYERIWWDVRQVLDGLLKMDPTPLANGIAIAEFENAVVTITGAISICDESFLLEESLYDLDFAGSLCCYHKCTAHSYSKEPNFQIFESEETVLPLVKIGQANYGHWLVEILPRLILARRHIQESVKFLIFPHPIPWERNRNMSLTVNDAAQDRIAYLQSATRFARIFYVSPIGRHPSDISPGWQHPFLKEFVAHQLSIQGAPPDSDVRLLVIRDAEAGRNLKEQGQIVEYLRERNFRIINASELTYLEQIQTFRNASIIVGVSGAAMTNAIFAPGGCKIIHLMPNNWANLFFLNLANLFEQDYYEIRGSLDPGGEYSIEPAELYALLKKLGVL